MFLFPGQIWTSWGCLVSLMTPLLVNTFCSLDGYTYMTWIFCSSQSMWTHNKQDYWKYSQFLFLLNNTERSAGIHVPSGFTSLHAFLCADISPCLRYGQILTVCWLLLPLLWIAKLHWAVEELYHTGDRTGTSKKQPWKFIWLQIIFQDKSDIISLEMY